MSVILSARNSGAQNGCAYAHRIPCFEGGGLFFLGGGEGGGRKCQSYFYGRGEFSDFRRALSGFGVLLSDSCARDFRVSELQTCREALTPC